MKPKPAIAHAETVSAVCAASLNSFKTSWQLKRIEEGRYRIVFRKVNETTGEATNEVREDFSADNDKLASGYFNAFVDREQATRPKRPGATVGAKLQKAREARLGASGEYRRTAKSLLVKNHAGAEKAFEIEDLILRDPDAARMLYNRAKSKENQGEKLTADERLICTAWTAHENRERREPWQNIMVNEWPAIIATFDREGALTFAAHVAAHLHEWYEKTGRECPGIADTAIRKAISRHGLKTP